MAIHRVGREAVLAVLLLVLVVASCDDPTRALHVPVSDRSMTIFAVLHPDSTSQPLWVQTVDLGPSELIAGLRAEVLLGDSLVARVEGTEGTGEACGRYGILGTNSAVGCPVLPFQPAAGQTYTVVVSADQRPTATATVRIPGEFEITTAAGRGDPPGTEGLSASWTPSDGAYRYMVALRDTGPGCSNVHGCPGGWYETTTETAIEAVVPERSLKAGTGGWYLDVYALDRGVYDYITSGAGGEFFSVPPASNVTGGHGVVGAWLRRSANPST